LIVFDVVLDALPFGIGISRSFNESRNVCRIKQGPGAEFHWAQLLLRRPSAHTVDGDPQNGRNILSIQ
jgi:hypothetical protein